MKGVQMVLKAIGVSIKPGANLQSLEIDGTVATTGENLTSLEVLEGAKIGSVKVANVQAAGVGSLPVNIAGEVTSSNL